MLSRPGSQSMNANILIVDDARLNREIFKLALLHDGYRFYEARTAGRPRRWSSAIR